jgi:hypothetical protein
MVCSLVGHFFFDRSDAVQGGWMGEAEGYGRRDLCSFLSTSWFLSLLVTGYLLAIGSGMLVLRSTTYLPG